MSESTTPPPLSTVKESWSQEEMAAREAMNEVPSYEGDGELPMRKSISRQSSRQHSRQQSRQPSPDKSLKKSPTKSPTKSPIKSQVQVKPQQQEEEEEEEEEDAPVTQTRISVDRRQTRTPEPTQRRSQRVSVQPSPSTPGRIAPFDWDDFEARYQKALSEADEKEKAILEEFDQLVKYFNVWASASSSHDNERAVKRLQTRTRFVHLSEQKLNQKKEHLSEVVKAFQSALALLSAA
ncbi:hypothetical protein PG993_014562 [Apiospora rasikravindrae]|uniref:Uncharacterized protein n=1 Tax=Apiospora rasikravindrae TaxID=990691 RepID=A0ABR1RN69_9PEZI